MLARDGAAERHARLEQPAQHLVALLGVGLEHREVHVAVAGVAAPGDQRPVRLPELGDLGHELGDGRARHDDVDDVVGVVRLRDPERLLARVDELHRGLRRQHVHVERAQLGELLAERLHVLVEPVRVLVLHHHDEVGERAVLDLGRDAEVEADVRGDRGHREHVDVLEDQRPDAAGDDGGHRARDLVEHGERREHRGLVLGARVEPEHRLGDERERALRADDELGEVVAGGRLHEPAAGADHLAGGEHRLEAEHLMAGDAVLHRAHAAGVGGDVAAEARAVLARVHGVDEPVRGR